MNDDFLTEENPFELSPSELEGEPEEEPCSEWCGWGEPPQTPPTNYKDDCPPSCAECGFMCLMEE